MVQIIIFASDMSFRRDCFFSFINFQFLLKVGYE